METILILIYTAWAVYSGYKFLSGRSEWLDQKGAVNMLIKLALSLAVGYVIAIFYLGYFVFKVLRALFDS